MADLGTFVIDGINAYSTGVAAATNAGGGLNDLNQGAQVTATIAGAAAAVPALGAPATAAAISAGGFAMGTEAVVLANDINNAEQSGWTINSAVAVTSDALSMVGDAATVTGSIATLAGAEGLSNLISVTGAGLNAVGTTANALVNGGNLSSLYTQTENSLSSAVSSATQELQSISSDVSGIVGSAATTLDNELQSVESMFGCVSSNGSIDSSALDALSNNLLSSAQTTASSLETDAQDVGGTSTSSTESISDNSSTLYCSDTPIFCQLQLLGQRGFEFGRQRR